MTVTSDGELIKAEDMETIKIAGKFAELTAGVSYQSGSNDYHRDELVIQRLINRNGNEIPLVWKTEWTELAPGITARRDKDSNADMLRICKAACPVTVKLLKVSEYVCYDYPDEVFRNEYWIWYVKGNELVRLSQSFRFFLSKHCFRRVQNR